MTPFASIPARRQPVDVMLALAWRKRFESCALFEYGATLTAKVSRHHATVFVDYVHKGQRFTLCSAPGNEDEDAEAYLMLYNGTPCTYRPETAARLLCFYESP